MARSLVTHALHWCGPFIGVLSTPQYSWTVPIKPCSKVKVRRRTLSIISWSSWTFAAISCCNCRERNRECEGVIAKHDHGSTWVGIPVEFGLKWGIKAEDSCGRTVRGGEIESHLGYIMHVLLQSFRLPSTRLEITTI